MGDSIRYRAQRCCFLLISVAALLAFGAFLAKPAEGGFNAAASINLHLLPVGSNPCQDAPRVLCINLNTRGVLYPARYYVCLTVMNGDAAAGVGGVHCGVDYSAPLHQGVDVYSWTLCGSVEFPVAGISGPWPAAGSSNTIVWDSATRCQRFEPGGPGTGVSATAGYFYCSAYSPDLLKAIASASQSMAYVTDCSGLSDVIEGGGTTHSPSQMGFVGFGLLGYTPCGAGPIAVEPTTWSRIKAVH